MSDVVTDIRTLLANNPAVLKAAQAFLDEIMTAAVKIGEQAALAALPSPIREIASLVTPLIDKAEAALQAKLDAEIQSLEVPPATATPGSGQAGLVSIDVVSNAPAPPNAEAKAISQAGNLTILQQRQAAAAERQNAAPAPAAS